MFVPRHPVESSHSSPLPVGPVASSACSSCGNRRTGRASVVTRGSRPTLAWENGLAKADERGGGVLDGRDALLAVQGRGRQHWSGAEHTGEHDKQASERGRKQAPEGPGREETSIPVVSERSLSRHVHVPHGRKRR